MSPVPPAPNAPRAAQGAPELLNDLRAEVAVEAAPLLQYIARHAGLIVLVLVVLILALAGTATYRWYAANTRATAQNALQKALQAPEGEQRLTALEAFATSDAAQSVRIPALLALAEAAIAAGQYDRAATAYGLVGVLDEGGVMGHMAALNEGQLLLRAGKAHEALTVLEGAESNPNMPEAQRQLAQQLLAEAAVMAGDREQAVTAFRSLWQGTTGVERAYFAARLEGLGATPSVAPQEAAPATDAGKAPAAPREAAPAAAPGDSPPAAQGQETIRE